VSPADASIDRTAVREMVEDFWRSYILFMRDLQAKYPRASVSEITSRCMAFSERNYWRRFEAISARMSPEKALGFLAMVSEEDAICAKEHHFRPDALYRRLNLNIQNRGSKREQDAAYRRLGLDPAAIDAAIASGDDTARVGAGAAVLARMEAQAQPTVPPRRRQGLSEMAVRTAVRATIWQIIASLFRR
jgi:hypothetical protein